MGGALTHQVLGASFPVPEKEVNDAVRKLQDQNRNYEDIIITSEFSGEQIQVKIGDCVDAKHPPWSEFDIITKLGYVTQLGEHGKKGTNKVTIRFLEDGEHPIPKKWIERVGDEVDYVDTIARVMVDDAAELPSSPLSKRSSPLKRLQSRTGTLGALTHQNDAVRKLQDQNRNYEDIFITSEFSGEQIQVKIGDCVDAKHPLWSEFDIITKLGYVTQLGEHGKKGTNKVTIRFLDDGEHPIPKGWIESVGDEVDYVDAIARVMVDDAAELPSSPLPKRSSWR